MLDINAKDACMNDDTLPGQQNIAEDADTPLQDMTNLSGQQT